MATVYGVNRTLLNTPIGANVIGTGLEKASKFSTYDEYEASSLVADEVIHVGGVLPQGAIVTQIHVLSDDLGTGTTIDVGDADTIDRYINGGITATTGGDLNSFPNLLTIAGMGYVVGTADGDDQIQIKNLGATATGTIKIFIEYAL